MKQGHTMNDQSENITPSQQDEQPHPCDLCGKKIFYYQVHGTNPPRGDEKELLHCERCNQILMYLSTSFGSYK